MLIQIYPIPKLHKAHFPAIIVAPVASWVMRWPIDLVVLNSSSAQGKIFSTINGVQLTLSSAHSPKYC